MGVMDDEVRFAADLYRSSATYYDRYRLPYPEAMTGDLARRAGVTPGGPGSPGAGACWTWPAGPASSPSRCAAGTARCGRWMPNRA